MRVWVRTYRLLLPTLWLLAVPWLLFPTVAPGFTAVSLVFLLFLLFASNTAFPYLPQSPINNYLLVFLLMTGIAYVVSSLPDVSLPKLTVVYLGAVTYFLIFPRLSGLENVERLVPVLAICAGLVALAGFFTLDWPERQVFDLQLITDKLPHLSGGFSINFNEMAGTLLVFFPFVWAAVRRGNDRFQRVTYSIILVLVIILLFFTQSRGAFLGLLVIGLTWWLWGRFSVRKALPVVGVLVVGLLLAGLMAGLSDADLFEWLSAIDAGSKQGDAPATSWLTRLEIWQVASQMVVDYPVIGGGLYTFDPVSRANYVYETILPSFNLTHAHNLFLQTGTSLGIVGVLALIGIWGTVLVKLWQAGRSENERIRWMAAVFGASIVGYLFFNLFDTITFGQKPGLFVWVILAGGMGLVKLVEGETVKIQSASPAGGYNPPGYLGTPRERGWGSRKFHQMVVAYSPWLVLIVLFVSPAFSKNVANLRLDKARFQSRSQITVSEADFEGDVRRVGLVYYLAEDEGRAFAAWGDDPEGEAFLRSQGTIALMSGQMAEAIEWYDMALVLAPDSAETYLWRGVANEERGMIGLAESDFWRAAAYTAESEISDSTKAFIYHRLGRLMITKENWQAAADAFSRATQYEPNERWYYRELGDALTVLGDQEGASAAYLKAEAGQ